MSEIGRDKPQDADAVAKNKPLGATLWRRTQSFLSTALRGFGWPIATVVLGALFTYLFQQRAWNNERAVTKIQNDSNAAFEVGQQVSEFIDARWAAAEQLRRALQSNVSHERLKSARDKYFKNYDESLPNVTKWEAQVTFRVDVPFSLPYRDIRKAFDDKKPDCLTYALEFAENNLNFSTESGNNLLQLIDHCHGLLSEDVKAVVESEGLARKYKSCNDKDATHPLNKIEQHVCDIEKRTSHIWWLKKVLRCTILQRAIAIRETELHDTGACGDSLLQKAACFWRKYIVVQPPSKYRPLGETDGCVKDYREDESRGLASSKGRQQGSPSAGLPAR